MGKVITVISGQNKIGKTTVTAAIASSLAVLGFKTLCLDFGTGSNKLEKALGMTTNNTLGHVEHPDIPGLFLLSLSSLITPDWSVVNEMIPLFDEIRYEYDYCIVDTPYLVSPGFVMAHADADMSIIVTNGEEPKMDDIVMSAKYANDSGVTDFKLLINRFLPINRDFIIEAVETVFSIVDAQLIGIIPDNKLISRALQNKMPLVLFKKSRIVADFLTIACILSGRPVIVEEIPTPAPPPELPAIVEEETKPELITAEPVTIEKIAPLEPLTPLSVPTSSIPQIVDKRLDSVHVKSDVESESDTSEIASLPAELPSNFLGTYGDPQFWAKSTLLNADPDKLVAIHSIGQSQFLGAVPIRYRMWLHDLLDDKNIPYYIEVGGLMAGKMLTEIQMIYVERKNAVKAMGLINEYNNAKHLDIDDSDDSDSFDDSDYSDDSSESIPQKVCPVCEEEVDFDFYKCPYCKEDF